MLADYVRFINVIYCKADPACLWESRFGVPRLSETTGTIEMEIGKGNPVEPRAPHAKWGHLSFCGGYVADGRKFHNFYFYMRSV